MEGLTYSPLGFVVEVGESHRVHPRINVLAKWNRDCISRAISLATHPFYTAEGSGVVKGAPNEG